MKISQLEYFCAVARTEHITEAAGVLNITQPALTSSIQRMEGELGVSLFERDGRNIRLTEHGKAAYPHIRSIVEEWKALRDELEHLGDKEDCRVDIICSTHIISSELMAQILQRMPCISLRVFSPLDKDAFRAFDQHRIDLVLNHPIYRGEGVESLEIEKDEMVIIASEGGMLSKCSDSSISLASLSGCSFASYPDSTPLRIEFEETCRSCGFSPQIVFSANTVQEMLPLVQAGDIIAYVPLRIIEDMQVQGVKVLHVSDVQEMPFVGISWHSDRAPRKAVRVVLSCVLMHFGIPVPPEIAI